MPATEPMVPIAGEPPFAPDHRNDRIRRNSPLPVPRHLPFPILPTLQRGLPWQPEKELKCRL